MVSHFFGSTKTLLQHVYTIPVVTTDPLAQTVLVGHNATFVAAATGFPTPTVQWQVSTDGGQAFANINVRDGANLQLRCRRR